MLRLLMGRARTGKSERVLQEIARDGRDHQDPRPHQGEIPRGEGREGRSPRVSLRRDENHRRGSVWVRVCFFAIMSRS